jgi:cyclopropane fatty-acyl-phospholipid synthase-like methyltransferase
MLRFHLDPEIDVSSRNMCFIDRSVEWLVSRFNIGPGTKIADFGCGPGLYAERLARRHAAVTGIDFSQRSIEFARKTADREGLAVHYINRSYLDLETDSRFDLILMIMCDYCALGPAQRKKMLSTFHRLLEPSGSVLLDAYSLQAFSKRQEKALYEVNLLNGFWSPGKYYGFLNTFKYEKENRQGNCPAENRRGFDSRTESSLCRRLRRVYFTSRHQSLVKS